MTTLSNSGENTLSNGTNLASASNSGGSLVGANDPSTARLFGAGLANGASSLYENLRGRVLNSSYRPNSTEVLQPDYDWRLRVSMQPESAKFFYTNPQNALLAPLRKTLGVIFPYTPSVSVSHTARYNPMSLTHSNYSSYFYEGSDVAQITISGEFTVQNVHEGQYLMAAIQFFRSCTKMFYGQKDPLAGTPPPLLFLNGYGAVYLPNVSCVLTTFNHTMPNDVDYIDVPIMQSLNNVAGNQIQTNQRGLRTRLPVSSSLQITLQPVYSRNTVSNGFKLEEYARGNVYNPTDNKDGSMRGGFL